MARKKLAKLGRRVRPDGSVWYYRYKRKHGRHKKPGPKKKKISKPRTYLPWDYIIVQTRENKQAKYVGRYHTIQDAYAKKEEIEKLNSEVVFPRQKVNNGEKQDEIFDDTSQYLILEKNTSNDSPNKLRNEFGKFIVHEVVGGKWLVVDKFPCVTEETFWVYGYNNKTDRKTFDWIYNELVEKHIEGKYDIVLIYLYNNKVIFKYDNDDFEFVICKCISDAIRMYNLIEERSKKKRRQVILTGGTGGYSKRGKEIIEMIRKKTGWKNKKIWERSTRH